MADRKTRGVCVRLEASAVRERERERRAETADTKGGRRRKRSESEEEGAIRVGRREGRPTTRGDRAAAVLESTTNELEKGSGRVRVRSRRRAQGARGISPEIPRMERTSWNGADRAGGLVGCTEGRCQPAYRRRALYRMQERRRRMDNTKRE